MTRRLPQTDSIQELARFWDTHDLADFEDELEEVQDPVFARETLVKIRLLPEEVEAVKRLARSRGIGCTDLLREWVSEKLHGQRTAG
jgi:predicted DNA binding CopG/RHH family protein